MNGSQRSDQNENAAQLNEIRHAADCTLRLNAGDTDHGSAEGSYLRVRNTPANLLAPLTAPEEDQSGGATATSGGTTTANEDSTLELRSDQTSEC